MNTSEFQIDILHKNIESMIKAHYQINIKKIIKEVVKNKDKDAKELETFILDNLFEPVQKKAPKKAKSKEDHVLPTEDFEKKLQDTIPENEKEFWGDDDVKQSYYPDKTTPDESKPCENEEKPIQPTESVSESSTSPIQPTESVAESSTSPIQPTESVAESSTPPVEEKPIQPTESVAESSTPVPVEEKPIQPTESVAESSTPVPVEEKQKKPVKRQTKKKEPVVQPTESVAESSTPVPVPVEEKQKKPVKRQTKKKDPIVPPIESVESTQAQQAVKNIPKPEESFQSQKSFDSVDDDEVTSKMDYEPSGYEEEPF
ncbi:hypothetical protein CYMTET_2482 [Cymbomonas tetramitiformis]|uniref:Uncharacterized protein n=1 Tax=Cymbomonas tetramitiformis TaxID=36881 RepID=A0AAE0H505_9CHLO|nr:hypothetical protein CYMTET_2482 [Cymbomonas tetramitiformis]